MRTERLISGLNNSQKIRVIVSGVAFITTVAETENILTTKHRTAVQKALMNLSESKVVGFGFNCQHFENGKQEYIPVQVDLV